MGYTLTVVTIPVFINATEGWILNEMIIPFVLMCIYSAIMFSGHFLTIMSAFMFNRKLLLLGVLITAVGMLLWLILMIAAFFPRTLEDYVCINHVCADSQWLIDLRWRYKKSDCPFRKGDPAEYPVFRKDFFVDAPRDELWQDNKKMALSYNLVIKKNHLMDQEHLGKVINFKAWYPGCESNDTVLILISIILAVAYTCFIGHLWWMVLSLRYLIVEEENEYDDEDEASY
ncbi:uncharacterized protein isoform X2 [Rhodnius prolixus]|uniref:uncharacterized protein isoform X2 n=1 Tax=Rhodnius prolixus TaxID=13249 RepID=UPI003D189CC9